MKCPIGVYSRKHRALHSTLCSMLREMCVLMLSAGATVGSSTLWATLHGSGSTGLFLHELQRSAAPGASKALVSFMI